jgi:uncharacterized protein YbjT (DUF2867 family)
MTTAWLAGATGLVGGELLRLLLADATFSQIVSVGRRTLPVADPKLTQAKVDFAAQTSFDNLASPGVAFSCLGTTIKKAGSREAFRAVDHDAVVAFATVARAKGATVFVHVSSLGADPRSRTFYAAVKGETELAVAALGYESVYALRPSILDGDRAENRPLERVGLVFARVLSPVLGKYRPTLASAVARTMIEKVKQRERGAHVIDAGAIGPA